MGKVLEQAAGRVGSPGHEPPGDWVAPPGLGGSDGQHHARTYDMTFAFDQILIMPLVYRRKSRNAGP